MKKLISWVMLVIMLFTSFGSVAYVETKSGKCGDNVTYKFSDEGVLTIEGYGPMYNTEYDAQTYSSYEWIDEGYIVEKVVLASGITTIGASAFEGLKNVKGNIVIPEGVTEIGMGAFSMTGLTSVNFPKTLKKVGNFVFT